MFYVRGARGRSRGKEIMFCPRCGKEMRKLTQNLQGCKKCDVYLEKKWVLLYGFDREHEEDDLIE